jgi:DNA-directed RNA polymerase specialized sigma24 family protein
VAAVIADPTDPPAADSGDDEDAPHSRKRRPRELTREAFEKLLQRLHPEREKAAERYEMLRQKAVFFLRHHADPESLADDVFDIVGSKLAEGEEIERVERYVLGVARRRWSDARRKDARVVPLDAARQLQHRGESPLDRLLRDEESRSMQAALSQLPEPDQRLYIRCEAREVSRRELGRQHHMTEDALNTWVHRTRRKVQGLWKKARREVR